jgi:CheY-like chemotaxis protein
MVGTTTRDRTVLVATERSIAPNVATSVHLLVEATSDQLLARAAKTQPDVVLIDLTLPGLNGQTLMAALRTVSPVAELIFTLSIHESLKHVLAAPRRRLPQRRAVAALTAIVEQMGLTPAELRDLANAMGESSQPNRDESQQVEPGIAGRIAGPLPPRRERARLEFEALERYFEERRHLLEDSLSTNQVAKLLGTSRQTPHDRVRGGMLLAVHDGGKLRFPPWQFDPEGEEGVIAGLPQTLRALRVSPLAAARWLTRPNQVLEGRTPLDSLRGGDIQRVVAEASGVGPL